MTELHTSPHAAHPQYRRRRRTEMIVIHQSHTPPGLENVVAHLRSKGRENGLLDVGYHYVIEENGHITCTRFHDLIGSHAPGWNHTTIAICLAGDFADLAEIPGAQLRALRETVGFLLVLYGIHVKVLGHYELPRVPKGSQRCPAFDMKEWRKAAGIVNPTGTPPLPLPPPAEGGSGLSPQCSIVLSYLQTGKAITNLIALTNLGIGSLSSRIAELRAAGNAIVSEDKRDFNGRSYASYSLTTAHAA